MKLLVTGAPGTGKTVLVEYAHKHGYDNFFDTDTVIGLCEWREYTTGKVIGFVEEVTPVSGDEWYSTYGWYWKSAKLQEILRSTANPVICGSADNIMDFYSLFDKIVLLYKSREDIVNNLLTPGREQPNGKDPAHHDRILRWQEKIYESLKPYKPILISDNTVDVMFDKILRILDDLNAIYKGSS